VDIAYNLPVYLRSFYYQQLVEIKKSESESDKNTSTSSRKRIEKPF